MPTKFALPALPPAASVPAGIKAAVPALTVMVVNGALSLLAAVLILIAGWSLSQWLGRWLRKVLERSNYIDETLKPLLANFARYGILAVTIVAVLGQFGVQTPSLIAVIGAAGLALGLALQGTLSNVASGVMLLFLRPFRVAERITLADVTGTVREIGLFRTLLITDDGRHVSIPNATIFSGIIFNNSRETMRRATFTVDIDHGEDIGAAQEALLKALAADPLVLKAPEPEVLIEAINGGVTLLSVQAWVHNSAFLRTQSELRKLVRQALEAAHVSPPIPIPAPAVPPWTPPPDGSAKDQPNKPN